MKISAIIPVYNGKKFIKMAVQSVIEQTLQPHELIIVDDGSTDDSLKEIATIRPSFPIRVYTKKNGGQSSARNYGIREAQGDLIALLDQDDVWHYNHLEILAKPFKTNPDLGWAYSNVDQIDSKGNIINQRVLDKCGFQHPQTDLEEMIRYDMHILPGASLIQKKALYDIGMFDEELSGYEDDDLFLRLYMKKWEPKYFSESLLQWRIHATNSGHLFGRKSREIYFRKVIQHFPSNENKNYTPAEIMGVRFFNTLLTYYNQLVINNEFSKFKEVLEEMKKYKMLAPEDFQRKNNPKFLKYPKLYFLKLILKRIVSKL